MDLFNIEIGSSRNLLPQDGTVHYYGTVFSQEEANQYYQKLFSEIEWKNDEAIIFAGKLSIFIFKSLTFVL